MTRDRCACHDWPVTDPSRRRLLVMRHAAAVAVGPSDLERELTPQGHLDATEVGEWLASRGVVADAALVSTAARTRDTWAAVAAAADWDVDPDFSAALYAAGTESALDLVRLLPDGATTGVLLGHNPTVAALVHLLDDGTGDPALLVEMAGGYPPGSVTLLELEGPWDELAPGRARVVEFHVPGG